MIGLKTNKNMLTRTLAFLLPILFPVFALNMPPLDLTKSSHTSDFTARKNHPTSYEQSPKFLGPLPLSKAVSTSENRVRIKNYFEHVKNVSIRPENPLSSNARTDVILKTIVNHFAYHDAPVDVKEMAESIEFYLRTRKRLLGAASKRHAKNIKNADSNLYHLHQDGRAGRMNVVVHDLCSGHGLTGMLFAACNPPSKDMSVSVILVDVAKPPAHQILYNLISDVCPWVKEDSLIEFQTRSLETVGQENIQVDKSNNIVLSIHACGSLTDLALEKACHKLNACVLAVMPCCYTGTDKGMPYGMKRALGVAWCADIRRSILLQENGYHTDFSTIPSEITPLNRIIVAEDRS
jgi:hypothetical protein